MTTNWLAVVATVFVLLAVTVPAVAAQPTECANADRGPGGDGPPGFVADLVPDFLSELFAALPVPDFVKSFFGAPTC